MKKIHVIRFVILVIVFFLVLIEMCQYQFNQYLYSTPYIDFRMGDQNDAKDINDEIKKLNNFSSSFHIDIFQYKVIDDNTIDFYMAGNRNKMKSIVKMSSYAVKVYPLQEMKQEGSSDKFYVNIHDAKTKRLFQETFSDYPLTNTNNHTINVDLKIIILLVSFVVFLAISFLPSNYRKKKIIHILLILICVINFVMIIENTIESSKKFMILKSVSNNHNIQKTKSMYRVLWNEKLDSDDYKKERENNIKAKEFYDRICKNKNAFLIDTDNYVILDYKQKNTYCFNDENPNDVYSPDHDCITVNENYLKYNHIYNTDNKLVINDLKKSKDTLNILVPSKYWKYVDDIKKQYLEYFYFQKVEVDNLYNEKIGESENTMKKDQLTLNMIKVKDHQNYFSYNMRTGDLNNEIWDPITIVYMGEFDSSYEASVLTSSVYYNGNKGNTMLKKDMNQLDNRIQSRSVYNEYLGRKSGIERFMRYRMFLSVISIIELCMFFSEYGFWKCFFAKLNK